MTRFGHSRSGTTRYINRWYQTSLRLCFFMTTACASWNGSIHHSNPISCAVYRYCASARCYRRHFATLNFRSISLSSYPSLKVSASHGCNSQGIGHYPYSIPYRACRYSSFTCAATSLRAAYYFSIGKR